MEKLSPGALHRQNSRIMKKSNQSSWRFKVTLLSVSFQLITSFHFLKKYLNVLFSCPVLKGHISHSPLHPALSCSNFTSFSLSYQLRSLCPGSLSDLAKSKAPCCCNSFFSCIFALRLNLMKMSPAYKPRSRLFECFRLSCFMATAVWWSVCAACHPGVDGGGRDEQKGSQVGENVHRQVLAPPSYTALFFK